MKIGLSVGFITSANPNPVQMAVAAENLGYDSVWVAEAWGSDAVSVLAWIGAKTERIRLGTGILQIPSRSPALTAMTAATIDRLSKGRLLLGLGVSGPQVIEGWHGVDYGTPLLRTREAIAIIRQVLAHKNPLTYKGNVYRIPIENKTNLGKPLKLMLSPTRKEIPIYVAAIGPKNVALAREIANGWLPLFYSPHHQNIFKEALATPGHTDEFDIAPSVQISMGQDLEACRNAVKPNLALYIGGMGAKDKNFYNALAHRYGYGSEATLIQELYLNGKKNEAIAAVPDSLVDDVALCGPRERIIERLQAWKDSGVSTLICMLKDQATLEAMPDIVAQV